MSQEPQDRRQEPEHRMPSLGERLVYGFIIVGALGMTAAYGLDGLIGFALFAGFVLLSARRESSADEQPRKPLPNAFNEQKFGPEDDDVCYNPAFHDFPGNCYHKNFRDKN